MIINTDRVYLQESDFDLDTYKVETGTDDRKSTNYYSIKQNAKMEKINDEIDIIHGFCLSLHSLASIKLSPFIISAFFSVLRAKFGLTKVLSR